MQNISLQINLFDEIIGQIVYYYVDIIITNIVAYAMVRYSKMCITHTRSLRIDLKFGNKLILSISTDL